jgi:small subunit ribosomal protein S16
MLKIRLQRVGRKNDPAFRVVVTEHTNSTKSGRYLEVLGSYDPRKSTEHFDAPRIKEWMSKGATLSDTLHNLFISKKIIDGKKINVLPKKSPVIDEEKVAAEKAAAEAAEKAKADAEAAAAQALADKEAEAAAPAPAEKTPAPEVVAETPAPVETPEEKPAE